jgi:hypothetical protein
MLALLAAPALAQEGAPGPHADEAFDFMNVLTKAGLHDIQHESWNLYGQLTWIEQFHPTFQAKYTNLNGSPNSLLPGSEWGETGTATLFFGVRLWTGAEGYFVPEVITEQPFSSLKGLTGAIQNFELQKGGTAAPQIYRAQLFIKQTIEIGGDPVVAESNPLQLGTVYRSRRLDFVLGNFTLLDFFDRTPFGLDPRQGLFSLAYLAYPAWDFASDARGYSWGAVAEFYWDDWAVRIGRMMPPQEPNQLPVDFQFWLYYGDELEIEHRHRIFGFDGMVRLLGFHNHVFTGSFNDAVAAYNANPQVDNAANCAASPNLNGFNYGSTNATAPDLCWVRKPNDKFGVGLYFEQYFATDIGVFFRGMYTDGQSEVDAYTSADDSLSLGFLAKGTLWRRPFDVTGIAGNMSFVSPAHAAYLKQGGIDGFIGDGYISQGPETTFDIFYSFNFLKAVWLSADYQHIINPGMNTDRGPVDVFGWRVHAEF